ncbi:MAG: N-acetylmuramoyl-L-alanine amidase [Alphaproteobacteria bacterium]|nr:N-acetylmuramoyl-L-alanine amidase [Alphaproteobacteria bacterium SS10]
MADTLNIIEHPSPNFSTRLEDGEAAPIDHLILHYTGMTSGAEALERLCDPDAKVSSHYLVEEDGRIFRLVDEQERAWHAGVAYWRGSKQINRRSIGIEIVNPGHEHGYRAFPDVQINAVVKLCQDILNRHPIPTQNILGHSDVAPWRKEDPGELFPWAALAVSGIGQWPNEPGETLDANTAKAALSNIGYLMDEPSDLTSTVIAFQRRYRPKLLNGQLDDETCRLIAAVAQTLDIDVSANPG